MMGKFIKRRGGHDAMIKIISGGQSGVDRAALDLAIRLSYPYGGWCPQGGLAEDYPTPPGLLEDYPALRETPTQDYNERTELNVRDSDATLIIAPDQTTAETGGTAMTQDFAIRHMKPFFVARLDEVGCCLETQNWLRRQKERKNSLFILNAAGPRLSKAPNIYRDAAVFLKEVLRKV